MGGGRVGGCGEDGEGDIGAYACLGGREGIGEVEDVGRSQGGSAGGGGGRGRVEHQLTIIVGSWQVEDDVGGEIDDDKATNGNRVLYNK